MIGFDKVCEILHRTSAPEEVSEIEITIDREGGLFLLNLVRMSKN